MNSQTPFKKTLLASGLGAALVCAVLLPTRAADTSSDPTRSESSAAASGAQPSATGSSQTGTAPGETSAATSGGTSASDGPAARPERSTGALSGSTDTPSASATSSGTAASGERILTSQKPGQHKTDELVGKGVVGEDGKEVGEINSLVLDERGQVVAAVVGVGGFLGIGDKEVAVSWEGLQMTPDERGENVIRTNVTKEELEEAPRFESLAEIEERNRREQEEQRRASQAQQPAGGLSAPSSSPTPQ